MPKELWESISQELHSEEKSAEYIAAVKLALEEDFDGVQHGKDSIGE